MLTVDKQEKGSYSLEAGAMNRLKESSAILITVEDSGTVFNFWSLCSEMLEQFSTILGSRLLAKNTGSWGTALRCPIQLDKN